jgi:pimeloyl-ACP methyl ester carboxylesterase
VADVDDVRTLELRGRDGLRLAATAAGNPADPPVLLTHGGGQTRHSWHGTTTALGANGWYAVSLDLRGHGDSEWAPDGDYSLDAFSGDVIEVARTLGTPVLIGASLGGTSSLAALGRTADDLCGSALVMVDVSPRIEPAGAQRIFGFMTEHMESGFGSLEEVADAVHAYNPHRPRPADLSGLAKNVRQRADGRWYWHWDPAFMTLRPLDNEARTLSLRADILEGYARSLTVPTALIRGRHSDVLSEEGVREFMELVPHTRFIDVGGAGHMVAGDRNDAFNDGVMTFLDDVRNGVAACGSGGPVD